MDRDYVKMRTIGEKRDGLGGHVFVVEGNKIVGIWEGVEFKRIPVLYVLLPPWRKAEVRPLLDYLDSGSFATARGLGVG